MKGNDGKGRRNALMRKLTCIVLGFGGLLTVLSVLGIGNHSNRLLMHHDDQLPKTNMRRLVSQSVSRFWRTCKLQQWVVLALTRLGESTAQL